METPPFTCPHCDLEIVLPQDAWYVTCPKCNHRLDLKSQFAYLRGLDAFSEGQDTMYPVNPRRRRTVSNPRMREAMDLFKQAYSSIQVAFQADLAEGQRALAVEMMSSMASEFMKWNMISTIEMNYWNSLMVEQTAQREYDRNKAKLAGLNGPLAVLPKMRWQARQKQLLRSLSELDRKIKLLERQIEFLEVPRARNESWKP